MNSPGVWAVIQTIGRQGASFSIFLILSRLLSPKDFGLLGMAVSWVGVVNAFSELGFSAAIIQRKNIEEDHLSTTFFVNVGLGMILFLIGIGMSIPAALFFKTPEIRPVIAILSITFLVNSFSLTHMAIAQKELQFKNLAVRDLSASIIGGTIGIIAACLGFGVWSLIIQIITTAITSSFLLWRFVKWRPSYKHISSQGIKDLWPYSSKILYFNIFKYFAQNTDKLLIGYFLGPVSLGLYTFAFKIVVFPITTLVGAIGNYLFPKYSKMQDDILAIRTSYLYIDKMIGVFIAPILIFIITLSPFIIPLLLGEKWEAALPLFPIMAVTAFLQTIISPVGNLLKAINKPCWILNWSFFITFLSAALMMVGVRFDIEGVALGLAFAYAIGIVINIYILKKVIFLKFSDAATVFLKKFVPVFLIAGIIFPLTVKEILEPKLSTVTFLFVLTTIYIYLFYRFNRSEISILFMKLRKGMNS